MNRAVVITFDPRNLWGVLVYATDANSDAIVDAISAALLAGEKSTVHEIRQCYTGKGIEACDFHSTCVHGMRSMDDDLPKVGQLVQVQLNKAEKILSVWYEGS
jgi:hypothetical protein